MKSKKAPRRWPILLGSAILPASPALAIDQAHRDQAREMAARAVAYLRTQQAENGGWAHNPQGPNLPAISGLVLTALILDPDIDASDPDVADGLSYVLTFRQPDGGIYDRILPSYNTSICLSAIAHAADDPGEEGTSALDQEIIKAAQDFLIALQYSEDAGTSGEAGSTTQRVTSNHPFYGGIGYGQHGRPDNSNLNLMLQALHDSGLEADHEAFQRAVTFLERTQMLDAVNDMPYADGSSQGGFIYATGPDSVRIGQGETKAGMITETTDDGTNVSRLRAYGSMTYAGFKSYLYADLERDDPRVQGAFEWIQDNYTLEENPGVGTDGLYYYYLTFARALSALGEDTIQTVDVLDDGSRSTDEALEAGERDWANDLIDQLATLQNDDGSFQSVDDRWMEDNSVLITAYSLIALQHAAAEGR